jgi:hypothetical protein
MHEMQAAETAGEGEGKSEGLFDKVMGFVGEGAHMLHGPAEILGKQAHDYVEQLEGAIEPFSEAYMPGGLSAGKLNAEMLEGLGGVGNSSLAREVAMGTPSQAQWQEILAANKGATEAAEKELGPALSKAGMWHKAETGLGLLAAAGAAHEEYNDSSCQTTAGKSVDAALAGGTNFALTKTPLALVDGAMGLAGSGLSWGGEKLGLGGMKDAGDFLKHNKPGHSLAAGLGGAVTAVEGLITGDSKGMENWNKESLAGNHGMILQGFSQIGNLMANSKAMDKVFDWICD